MVGFLLGHALDNGVGQRSKTSSIAMRLARSGELRFEGILLALLLFAGELDNSQKTTQHIYMLSIQSSYAENSALILNGRPTRLETDSRSGASATHGRDAHAP
jgi:hypothetical protein